MKGIEPSETNIARAIRQYLRLRGIAHFKHWGGPMSERGVADLICCWRGHFLAIEVKTRKGALSDDQARFLERIKAAGGIALVARSVDDVIDAIERLDPEQGRLFTNA